MTDVLKVKMLDGFSVQYKGSEIIDARQASSQFGALMQLLLYFRKTGAPRNTLREVLFEQREVEDAQHAIRNILYNAKKKLRQAGMEDLNYVEVRQGAYFFTDQIPVALDTEEMEAFFEKAKTAASLEEKLSFLLDGIHLYRQGFLQNVSNAVWAVHEGRKLRDHFRVAVDEAAEILRENKDYKDLMKLGEYASKVDSFADWEVLIVEGMAGLGRYDEAEKFCDDTVQAYVDEYGQRDSTYIRELYNRLNSHLMHRYEDIDEIQDKLLEPADKVRGGYFCPYPVFQGVYRITQRTMDRQADKIFLMLCTIVDSKGNPMKEGAKLEELSDRLMEAIVRSVRHSDTVTKYGKSQFLVLLMNTTRENCPIVEKRINKNFMIGRQRTGIDYSVKSVIVPPSILQLEQHN